METENSKVRVAGFVRNSFVDWPGKISFVVFLGGCNLSCPHCHNHDILGSMSNRLQYLDVRQEIEDQIGFIDGVVISGGEPTTHWYLREIIEDLRSMGLAVKLDTNGTNYELLRELVNARLVDFVAMDIKAPLDRYAPLGFIRGDHKHIAEVIENVRKSIEFLKGGRVPFMFRTTPIPELEPDDFVGIGQLVGGAPWTKNEFVPQNK
jgi:pyruvate formate lyase activating enzyme